MEKQLELFETRFNHNDFEYEMWYDQRAEMSEDEEGNPVEFECDTVYARTEFGKAFIDWINSELYTEIKFKSMFFPKEYNFYSDAINIEYTLKDVEKVKNWIKSDIDYQNTLKEKIEGYSTSCSGYIAFHNEEDFYNKHELLMGVMLEIFASMEESSFSDYFQIQCIYDRLFKEV